MEPQDSQSEMNAGRPDVYDAADHAAPAALLPGVMARIASLDVYLTTRPSHGELQDALSDARWEVRAAALQAMGEREDADALDRLVAALRDEHEMVRLAAVGALNRRGRHAPIDQLILAARDPDPEVREAARAALQRRDTADAALTPRAAALRHQVAKLAPQIRRGAASVAHSWLVLSRQPAILQRSWLIPAVALLLSDGLTVLLAMHMWRSVQDTATLLGLATTLSAVIGIAYAADLAHDAGAELAAATATSLRTLLFSRLFVVLGATTLLSGCASVGVALLYRQGLWSIIQLWLGPLLLISALTLALALLVGSWLAFLLTSLLELAQTVRLGPIHQLMPLQHSPLWQTSPTMLLLAALCLMFAFLYAPRRSSPRRALGEL